MFHGNKMDIEDESIEFLEKMMAGEFADLMSELLVLDIEWVECDTKGEIRGIATMGDMDGNMGMTESKVVCLFPPFKPNKSK